MSEIINIREALRNGIRPDTRVPSNSPYLVECRNLQATEYGVKPFSPLVQPIEDAELTAKSFTKSWPFPQLFRGNYRTFICDDNNVQTVNEADWTINAQTTIYNLASRASALALSNNSKPWHFLDLQQTVIFLDGASVLMAFDDTPTWYHTQTRVPQTGCVHKDARVMFGGFPNGASWWNGLTDIQAWLQPHFDNAPASVHDWLDAFESKNFQNWVWWGSIGVGDFLGLWLLEYLLHGNMTWEEKITNGGFASGLTGWTQLGSGWAVSGGKAVHTPGSAGSLGQASLMEPGFAYKYSFTVSDRTAGTLASGFFPDQVNITANGTYTGVFISDDSTDVLFSDLAGTFDGAIDDVSLIRLGANIGFDSTNPWFKQLATRNESGMAPLPVPGQVIRMLPLGDAVMCYTTSGVAALVAFSNPVSSYGVRELDGMSRIGILSRSAAGGGDHGHIFIDDGGTLWGVSRDLNCERIGYQHIFGEWIGDEAIVEYDGQHQEWWLSNGTEAYVFRKGTLSRAPWLPTTVSFAEGGRIGIYTDDADDAAGVTVHSTRFRGTMPRRIYQITHITLVTVDTDATGWSVYVDYRLDVGAAWSTSEEFVTDARGHVQAKVSGLEFRIKCTHPDNTKCDLEEIIVELDHGEEKRSLARLL